jgi:hypothetical protein
MTVQYRAICGLLLILRHVIFGYDGISVHVIDNILALSVNLSPLPSLQQIARLVLEESGLNGSGATQSP